MLMSEQVRESMDKLRDLYLERAKDNPDPLIWRIFLTLELMEQRVTNIECFLKNNFTKDNHL